MYFRVLPKDHKANITLICRANDHMKYEMSVDVYIGVSSVFPILLLIALLSLKKEKKYMLHNSRQGSQILCIHIT